MSHNDEQHQRLRPDEPAAQKLASNVTDGRAKTCAEPAAGVADGIMRAIGLAAPPSGPQRAGLDALRQNSAAMAKLVAGSCPGDPRLTPLFFFSSRRRHTSCLSDWSSDVCSSD